MNPCRHASQEKSIYKGRTENVHVLRHMAVPDMMSLQLDFDMNWLLIIVSCVKLLRLFGYFRTMVIPGSSNLNYIKVGYLAKSSYVLGINRIYYLRDEA